MDYITEDLLSLFTMGTAGWTKDETRALIGGNAKVQSQLDGVCPLSSQTLFPLIVLETPSLPLKS